jgi:hypothetical protein
MSTTPAVERWECVIRDDAAVVAGLALGACDGILPDDWSDPDDLLELALEMGAFELLELFPDPRRRRVHAHSLYCRAMLAGALVDARSLEDIGRVLFSSVSVLDKLGVNFRCVREGGARTGDERIFDMEALGDFFALYQSEDFLVPQQHSARWLHERIGEHERVYALDGVDIPIPNGHARNAAHWKAMVLSVMTEEATLPISWQFGPAPKSHELALAKPLLKEVRPLLWGDDQVTLLVDAGFIDGGWLRELHDSKTRVIIRIREKMDLFVAARAQAEKRTDWRSAALPKRPATSAMPVRRDLLSLTCQPGWEAFKGDVALCLVRDVYADGKLDYWLLADTQPETPAETIYRLYARRWGIEEQFMALSRYHHLNALGACRDGVALAKAHFALLTYTLRWLCRRFAHQREQAQQRPHPWRRFDMRFIIYMQGYYALLLPSQVFESVFAHWDAWDGRREQILNALRYCEGSG